MIEGPSKSSRTRQISAGCSHTQIRLVRLKVLGQITDGEQQQNSLDTESKLVENRLCRRDGWVLKHPCLHATNGLSSEYTEFLYFVFRYAFFFCTISGYAFLLRCFDHAPNHITVGYAARQGRGRIGFRP